MKTILLIAMAVLLCGCREKSEQAWHEEIRTAAKDAAHARRLADHEFASPTALVDYQVAAERLEKIKRSAVADGVDAMQAELHAISGAHDK